MKPVNRRDWGPAWAKVQKEGRCRTCKAGPRADLDPAHIVPRSRIADERVMDERNIVPLCRRCHDDGHAHRLELLPHLTREEQVYIVGLVGIEEARNYTVSRGLYLARGPGAAA